MKTSISYDKIILSVIDLTTVFLKKKELRQLFLILFYIKILES